MDSLTINTSVNACAHTDKIQQRENQNPTANRIQNEGIDTKQAHDKMVKTIQSDGSSFLDPDTVKQRQKQMIQHKNNRLHKHSKDDSEKRNQQKRKQLLSQIQKASKRCQMSKTHPIKKSVDFRV